MSSRHLQAFIIGLTFPCLLFDFLLHSPYATTCHVFGDDFFGSADLLPAKSRRLFSDRLRRIHVVNINAAQFVTSVRHFAGTAMSMTNSGRSARSRRIGSEPLSLGGRFPKKSMQSGCRSPARCSEPGFKRDGRTTDRLSEIFGAGSGDRLAHTQIAHTPRDQSAKCPLARLAGAEDQSLAHGQVAKNRGREINRDRADRNRTARNFGMGANLFRTGKPAGKVDGARSRSTGECAAS